MSKLFSLLRATMAGGIQLFNYRGKTDRSRRVMPIVLGLLIGVMMLMSATTMTAELKESGNAVTILALYTMITAVIIVTEGIYKSGDLLFRPRDNDMLLAMPIKKSAIVLTRVVKFYVFEMLYCLIFLLPAIIAYAINVEVGASYYLVAITMLLLVPVIPIVISCIVGLVMSAITVNFKHRALLQVILSFVALFGFAVLILMLNIAPDPGEEALAMVGDKITSFYYPASAFVKLAVNFDWWQYLIFVVINLAVVIIAVLVIGRFYFQIVTRMNVVKREKSSVVNYNFTKHRQTFAMIKKELNKYFSTSVLIMNTAIGLVIFLVAVGAICFKFDDITASLSTSIENFPFTTQEIRSFLPGIIYVLVLFTSLMTYITATMISLEGKAFNLLKSLPISGKKVIMSKVLAAMILIVPIIIVGSVVAFFRFQFGVVDLILILVGTVAAPLVAELIGILANLKYARFDAETDAVAVKQSASVMVATFLGLGLVLTVIPFTVAVVFLAGQTVGLLIMDAVFIIVALFLYFVVVTWGEEKYRKLVA